MIAARRHVEKPLKKRFSRLWWLGAAHEMFWIILVSVLIWVYADIEYSDDDNFTATLILDVGRSENIRLLSESEHPLTFQLSGSKSSLVEFRQKLADAGNVLKLDLSQKNYGPGKVSVQTQKLLQQSIGLQQRGITLKNIQPEVIELDLAGLARIEDVPVDLDYRNATVDPPPAAGKVDLLVTQDRWKEIKKRRMEQPIRLTTQSKDLKGLQPGKHKVFAEILREIDGIPVEPLNDSITFVVEIISQEQPAEIPVTVGILTPAAWAQKDDTTWEEYVLVRHPASDWRPELRLVGPKKNLDAKNVRAFIQLTDDDKKPVSWTERQLIVTFAPGVDLKLQGEAPKVQFRLEKRTPTRPPVP